MGVGLFLVLLVLPLSVWSDSRSFELRYFSDSSLANGETDFKGPTAVFDTEQRVEFLHQYAEAAKRFFNDPQLNTKVVTQAEVSDFLNKLKPQPKPKVRERISLDDWNYLGYKEGQSQQSIARLNVGSLREGVDLNEGSLRFATDEGIDFDFKRQGWRATLTWRAQVPASDRRVSFKLSDRGKIPVATIGFGSNGNFFYHTADQRIVELEKYEPKRWYSFRLELDFVAPNFKTDVVRYNLYIDGKRVADYVPMERVREAGVQYVYNFSSVPGFNRFSIKAYDGVRVDDIWGVGYHKTGREACPYYPETYLDQNFEIKPDIQGWAHIDYDDSFWQRGEYPIIHGTERYAEEDLYLRKKVKVGDFEKAYLNIETVDPGGELWVNGQVIKIIHNRHPQKIDVTRFLKKHSVNLIGIKVNHFYLTEQVGEMMLHSYLDYSLGWFAGRASLDLVKHQHVSDAFLYTESIGEEWAHLKTRITFKNDHWLSFRGDVIIKLTPWFPSETTSPSYEFSLPVVLTVGSDSIEHSFKLENPMLWSPETPNLYKIEVSLNDASGHTIDDYVFTTGIRTVDQKGGSFRLNNQVVMANGAQIMGFRGPAEKLALWNRCTPDDWVAKELMMVKAMNGNLLRIHSHGWEFPARGINDPRYAEMADQMGMMLIWCPTAWIRTGRGWGDVDFEGFPKYIRQVYNHPSIIIWEAANHTQQFKTRDSTESDLYCEKVHEMIHPVDPSRLISYNSFIKHFHYGNDLGTVDHEGNAIQASWAWTAPRVTRGNQDHPTGYGKTWDRLREYPGEYRQDFLDSKERAYFNFEHQESIGQPNWSLVKGKPWYRVHSYEWGYDEGSIGRRLSLDEWQESQAWQAFSAWEAMKKLRYLDYDGFSWCCLHGGANSGTYKKPLIDMLDHAKLAFWVNRMVFQKTVAGSHNVDVVYGPEDMIRPVIIHWGDARTAELTVNLKSIDGKVLLSREYRNVELTGGRSAVVLEPFQPELLEEGYYLIEYSTKFI